MGDPAEQADLINKVDAVEEKRPSLTCLDILLEQQVSIDGIPLGDDFINMCFLAKWDNVFGPRIIGIWKRFGYELPEYSMLTYLINHTLCSELTRDLHSHIVDYKLNIIEDAGLLSLTFIFTSLTTSEFNKYSISVHCLCLIFPRQYRQNVIRLISLIQGYANRSISFYRALAHRKDFDAAKQQITEFVRTIGEVLVSLHACPIPNLESLPHDSLFADINFDIFPRRFVEEAIAYHLMYFGHSIVSGSSRKLINMFICTLALFCNDEQKRLSRTLDTSDLSVSSQDSTESPFSPYLFIQPHLKVQGNINIPTFDLLTAPQPHILIDIDLQKVQKMLPYAEHRKVRSQLLEQAVADLWLNPHSRVPVSIGGDVEIFPHQPELHQSILARLFSQLTLLKNEPLSSKLLIIDSFNKFLDVKACELINCITHRSTRHQSAVGQQTSSVSLSAKHLKKVLNLKLLGDYYLVLSAAEKRSPGVIDLISS